MKKYAPAVVSWGDNQNVCFCVKFKTLSFLIGRFSTGPSKRFLNRNFQPNLAKQNAYVVSWENKRNNFLKTIFPLSSKLSFSLNVFCMGAPKRFSKSRFLSEFEIIRSYTRHAAKSVTPLHI